jgi:hypothetical protein
MEPTPAQPEKDEAREARETLKKEWNEAIKKTKPKDTAAGLKSGIATAAAGVASGVVGLFAAPIVGAKQDGASGFAKGLATGELIACSVNLRRAQHTQVQRKYTSTLQYASRAASAVQPQSPHH